MGSAERLAKKNNALKGLTFKRHYTSPNHDPLNQLKYEYRSCKVPEVSQIPIEIEVPESWSQRSAEILASCYLRKKGVPATEHETSAKQVVHRIAHTIRLAGEKFGSYFQDKESAKTFEDELKYILIHQHAAFNSPVWYNCGIYHSYGIKGSHGQFYWDFEEEKAKETNNAFEYPQSAGSFIQSVKDDFLDILKLVQEEGKIFRYGSGTGTNFSTIRSHKEGLSSGGNPAKLISYLEMLDRSALVAKSGGQYRRAAKMVCLDINHPEILDFIEWKMREEEKVKALINHGYSSDSRGEAYRSISGQNANNSVRISNDFMEAVLKDAPWKTTFRKDGQVCEIIPSREIFQRVAHAAWSCADPGVQFDTTINTWNTCGNSGRINASNSCSEFMFLDNTACNLASINLIKYLNSEDELKLESFLHTIDIIIIAQDILVDLGSYPNEETAENTHNFRPLGLGYANLGAILMRQGIPYDSDLGRNIAATLAAIITGQAYFSSSRIASQKGSFTHYSLNAKTMQQVIELHLEHVKNQKEIPHWKNIHQITQSLWEETVQNGKTYGYRNAQVSLIAPTGTIGLLMDCDTTGIEPTFALVKLKKLSDGSFFKITSTSITHALEKLDYSNEKINRMMQYLLGTQSLEESPYINETTLKAKGFNELDLDHIKKAIPHAMHLTEVFSKHHISHGTLKKLGFTPNEFNNPEFNLLKELGFQNEEIHRADLHICGHLSLEGAPDLKTEHLPVFDCAIPCGDHGRRSISPMGHILMMAAVQPFISGAISKTVNLPKTANLEVVEKIYLKAWELGLKAVAIYRDQCKMSQPLNANKASHRQKTNLLIKDYLEEIKRSSIFSKKKEISPSIWPYKTKSIH